MSPRLLLRLLLLLLLLLVSLGFGGKNVGSQRLRPTMTVYRQDRVSWEEARERCRQEHTDLISMETKEEIKELVTAHGWIGLHRDGVGSPWKWSKGNRIATLENWDEDPEEHQRCAFTYSDKKTWFPDSCGSPHSYTCLDETLVLVKENKTWEEALLHCRSLGVDEATDPTALNRAHRYDLASLLTDDDHEYARELAETATTREVWTGLRFLAGRWFWVDGEAVSYEGLASCPGAEACGVLEKDGAAPYETSDCSRRRNFMCSRIQTP